MNSIYEIKRKLLNYPYRNIIVFEKEFIFKSANQVHASIIKVFPTDDGDLLIYAYCEKYVRSQLKQGWLSEFFFLNSIDYGTAWIFADTI